MVGATNIVSWDDSNEDRSSISASRLDTTKGVCLDSSVGTITIAPGLNTSIDSRRVAAPKLNISIRDGLAG